jgi:predicted dinucleotide-utilizing enzyme
MKKYNIAIIGLGYWGTIVTNTIISMNLFDKVYINDTDISKINILKKKFGKKVTEIDFDKILISYDY